MKKVCNQFREEHKIDVKICERGGTKLGSIAKSDPLKSLVCGRDDCFPCKNEGGGIVVEAVLPIGWNVWNVPEPM